MAEPDKRPVTLQERLVSSLAQTDALAKLLIEKGLITRRRVYAEDFRGTGDVSEAAESHAAMSIGEILDLGIVYFVLIASMETSWKQGRVGRWKT